MFSGVSSAATCTAVVVALHQAHRGERLNRQIVRMEIANGIKDKFQDQLTQSWEVLNDLRDLTSLTGRFGRQMTLQEAVKLQVSVEKRCAAIVAALKGILGRLDKEISSSALIVTENALYGVGYFSEVIIEARSSSRSRPAFGGDNIEAARQSLVGNCFSHIVDMYSVYGKELGGDLTERIMSQTAFPGKDGDDLIFVDMNDDQISKTLSDAFNVDVDNYSIAVRRWLQLRIAYEYHALVYLSSSCLTNWQFDVKNSSNLERATLYNMLLGHLLDRVLRYAKEDFDALLEEYVKP